MQSSNGWWLKTFTRAPSDPNFESRLTISILRAIEADTKSANKTIKIVDSDYCHAIANEGLFELEGPTFLSVYYDRSVNAALPQFQSLQKALKSGHAKTALAIFPLVESTAAKEPPSIKIMIHQQVVDILKRQLVVAAKHTEEVLVPELHDKIGSSWKKDRDQYINILANAYRTGLALVLGAGVSASAGLPNWRTLLDRLMVQVVRHYFNLPFSAEQENLAASLLTASSNDSPLVSARMIKAILEYKEDKENRENEKNYESALRSALYGYPPTNGNVPARDSKLLDEIVELCRPQREIKGVRAVITYNFDDLLEKRMKEKIVRYRQIPGDTRGGNDLPIFHVHGILPETDSRGSIDNGKSDLLPSDARH